MAKVTLEVNEKDLETFLMIIENLKEGMVKRIDIEKKRTYNKPKPLSNTPQKNTPKPVSITTGKYIDPQTFKERLKRMKR